MTINGDELVKALQENLKLRRGLATEVAGGKFRYRSMTVFGAVRHAFSGRISRTSVSAAMLELMTLDGAPGPQIAGRETRADADIGRARLQGRRRQ